MNKLEITVNSPNIIFLWLLFVKKPESNPKQEFGIV
jgi:hypothetical protein